MNGPIHVLSISFVLWPLGISIFCYGNVTGFVDGSLGLLGLLGLPSLLGLLDPFDPLDPLGLFLLAHATSLFPLSLYTHMYVSSFVLKMFVCLA